MVAQPVVIYEIPGHARSKAVCRAMLEGIARVGDRPRIVSSLRYRVPEEATVVFYGLEGNLSKAMRDYSAGNPGQRCVYIDLGYWARKDGTKAGRFSGFHKISVNSRHPTAYFQARPHPDDRAKALGLQVKPWKPAGGYILVAGMGPKGARAEGYPPNGWERRAILQIQQATNYGIPIRYRPKPNWPGEHQLAGAAYSVGVDLAEDLAGAHMLVARHSNAAVEALVAGVPVFVEEGVALPFSLASLRDLETRKIRELEGREQWLADVAYCQWSVAEMAEGLPWRHLKEEGLVP